MLCKVAKTFFSSNIQRFCKKKIIHGQLWGGGGQGERLRPGVVKVPKAAQSISGASFYLQHMYACICMYVWFPLGVSFVHVITYAYLSRSWNIQYQRNNQTRTGEIMTRARFVDQAVSVVSS